MGFVNRSEKPDNISCTSDDSIMNIKITTEGFSVNGEYLEGEYSRNELKKYFGIHLSNFFLFERSQFELYTDYNILAEFKSAHKDKIRSVILYFNGLNAAKDFQSDYKGQFHFFSNVITAETIEGAIWERYQYSGMEKTETFSGVVGKGNNVYKYSMEKHTVFFWFADGKLIKVSIDFD